MSSTRNKAFLSLFQPGASHRDAALAYASYRLFVHPLEAGSKKPLLPKWQIKATTDFDQIRKWWPASSKNNIGIFLKPSCVVVIDVDPRNGGDETFEALINQHGRLPVTYTVKSANNGRHYYYRVPPDFYDVKYPKALGPGVELLINNYAVAPPSELEDGRQYTIATGDVEHDFAPFPFDWVDEVIRAHVFTAKDVWHDNREDWSFEGGKRNDGATRIAGLLRKYYLSEEEIEAFLHICGRHGRFENYTEDVEFREVEIPRIAKSAATNFPGEIRLTDLKVHARQQAYKPKLDIEGVAFQGPIGEFVKEIEPYTEASPAALLVQSLAIFGNMVGATEGDDAGPGFNVEGGHHKTSEYVMIVGESALAGKGDSWSRAYGFFKPLDSDWRAKTGIQTGEAVINLLADDEETDTILHNLTEGSVEKGVKKGASDKRLLVYEPEFARIMHVAQRQGSIIKDVLRSMWDTGETESISKGSQQRVTNATFSLIAHCTKADLEREMSDVDLINGFGNRFLYVFAERTQHLPSAQAIPSQTLKELRYPLREALEFAQTAPIDYPFSPEAWDAWERVTRIWWQRGKKPVPAIEDQLSSRARPHVRRLAVIYAVADCSPQIELQHLDAALAVWQYCFDSVIYIFGNRIGDYVADKIYRALVEHAPGLSQGEIRSEVFKRNRSSEQVRNGIQLLLDAGLIQKVSVKVGRKTIDRFILVQHLPYQGEAK